MKTWKHLIFVGLFAITVFVFIACGNSNNPQPNTFTVTFNSNGGSTVNSITGLNSGDTITSPTNPIRNGFESFFVGWYDQVLENAFDFNSSISGNITLHAKWRPYEIGETGPGGGIIFYRNEIGFIMTDDNSVAHYLEAAPNDMPMRLAWASEKHIDTVIDGLENSIGAGRKNTFLILAVDPAAPAAKACVEFNHNGKFDWFLPNWREINELYDQIDKIDNISTSFNNFYWISEQHPQVQNMALAMILLAAPNLGGYAKDSLFFVRAIRAF